MIIEVENLVKRYGDVLALNHFNLQVEKGEILGLLGPNGSGKSTSINCMLSLLNYEKGEIKLFGVPMRPKKLSGGLLRRLNIACGIAHQPELIFLDEPTVAVDPQSRNRILENIKQLNAQGATIVYTTHYMEEVEQLCNRIVIMDEGKIIAMGTKEQLKAMIQTQEKITFEIPDLDISILEELNRFSSIVKVNYLAPLLEIQVNRSKDILVDLLDFFSQRNVEFHKVYSEKPSLNDVFLEITGKKLRD